MKKFIIDIFSSSSPTSSKRVFGAVGWIASIVFIAIWERELIAEMMYISAALIGLDTLKSGLLGLRKDTKNTKTK